MNERQEMLAALCVMGDGPKGRVLAAFLPPEEQEVVEKLQNQLLRGEGRVDGREVVRRLKKLAQLDRWSGLQEIHPGWILEALSDETPRVLGVICRFLSGDKVRYILNHLNPTERARLPKLTQSFSVAPEILEIVRALVEKRLGLSLPPRTGSFGFSHIAWMRGEDLRILFREIGLDQIRRAFVGADPQVFKAFLSRFSPVQAREIRDRIERSVPVGRAEKEKAQLHLVSLSLGTLPADELFREIGFSVFAKAVLPGPDEGEIVRRVCQRLSPEEGYRLLRLVQEAEATPGESKLRREAILAMVFSLGARKKIGRYWKEELENEATMSEMSGRGHRAKEMAA